MWGLSLAGMGRLNDRAALTANWFVRGCLCIALLTSIAKTGFLGFWSVSVTAVKANWSYFLSTYQKLSRFDAPFVVYKKNVSVTSLGRLSN